MTAKVEGQELVIGLPIRDPAEPSSSGNLVCSHDQGKRDGFGGDGRQASQARSKRLNRAVSAYPCPSGKWILTCLLYNRPGPELVAAQEQAMREHDVDPEDFLGCMRKTLADGYENALPDGRR